MAGFVKLHRKFLDWEWFDEPDMVKFFIYLMLKVNHTDKQWRGITIRRGQTVTSYSNLQRDTGLKTQRIRTILKRLKSTREITCKSTNKFTIITLVNYNTYGEYTNTVNKPSNRPSNNQATNHQQSNNNQLTTTKECKERKNEKNINYSKKPLGKKQRADLIIKALRNYDRYDHANSFKKIQEELGNDFALVKHIGITRLSQSNMEQIPFMIYDAMKQLNMG